LHGELIEVTDIILHTGSSVRAPQTWCRLAALAGACWASSAQRRQQQQWRQQRRPRKRRKWAMRQQWQRQRRKQRRRYGVAPTVHGWHCERSAAGGRPWLQSKPQVGPWCLSLVMCG
jgi:hypothetical protein